VYGAGKEVVVLVVAHWVVPPLQMPRFVHEAPSQQYRIELVQVQFVVPMGPSRSSSLMFNASGRGARRVGGVVRARLEEVAARRARRVKDFIVAGLREVSRVSCDEKLLQIADC
jgi:hypothetical protein